MKAGRAGQSQPCPVAASHCYSCLPTSLFNHHLKIVKSFMGLKIHKFVVVDEVCSLQNKVPNSPNDPRQVRST